MIKITLNQHPVGQGGMMSGLLQTSAGRFHWVYDCGSNQTKALNREIDAVAARGIVDCLFLSHLDSDHVKGIDYLLSRTSVREVVLPYLNNIDRLIAIAHDATEGTITGTFLTFLGDIEGWFNARGVERISFIQPRTDDDEGSDEPDIPDGGEGHGQGEITAKWSREGDPMPRLNLEKPGKWNRNTVALKFQTRASLQLMTTDGALNWLLAPYAHRPSDKSLEDFQIALAKKFKDDLDDPDFLLSILRDLSKLEQLRECYDLIWSNHNLVSMALYAGPMRRARWRNHCHRRYWGYEYHTPHWYRTINGTIAWLGTGDMHLNVKTRRESFIAHYRRLLELVNVFGLPHHGAKGNFNPLLLNAISQATQCVAAASKKNSYGHPSAEVKLQVMRSLKSFIRVGSKGRSALIWTHTDFDK